MQKGVFDLVHDFLIFQKIIKHWYGIDQKLYIVFTLKLVFVDIL